MEVNYRDFIGVYTNVYPSGFCEFVIDKFEQLQNTGAGYDRLSSENTPAHIKADYSMGNMDMRFPFSFKDGDNVIKSNMNDIFFKGLQQCYIDYKNQYSILDSFNINTREVKYQKTVPGEGYHVWHCEHGSGDHSKRTLVYILYLNTIDADCAGETEFLYQQRRCKPVENTLLIFPAAFTHTHRGNTVFGNKDKYIATGWFNL